MEIWDWLSHNWFNVCSSLGFMGGLWFTGISLYLEAKARQTTNLLTITDAHRDIWKIYLSDKKFERVRDASADTSKQPITDAERIFVNMVIQHLNSVYYMMRHQLVIKVQGMRGDIAQFLSLPIPREVWEKIKILQNADFVAFVESCRDGK
jgi:hypothetical protein